MTDMKSILENRPELARRVAEVAEVAGYLWQKGWAERNGGNISVNVTGLCADAVCELPALDGPYLLPKPVPHIAGGCFLVTGTGRRMRYVASQPLARSPSAISSCCCKGNRMSVCTPIANARSRPRIPANPCAVVPAQLSPRSNQSIERLR